MVCPLRVWLRYTSLAGGKIKVEFIGSSVLLIKFMVVDETLVEAVVGD